ncbi:MAG: cytochrome c [Actinomycetota bacterium]|nr:cytochrome c [Actinomycetota bacterium]
MPGHVSVARGKAIAAVSLALLAGALASGCDTQEEADLERGKDLFTNGCSICHALTEARATATIGPSLDSSFAQARANGMDQDTIEGIVEAQIENPRDVDEADPDYVNLYMPAKIFTGSDAEDVAAYVASVAGVEGIEPPALPEEAEGLFTEQCGGCHQLEDAGTAGGIGPNLDDVLPGQDAEMIDQSIREPEAELSPGFESGIMPVFDENAIPDQNLADLVDYLIESTGGATDSASGSAAGSAASGGK